MSWYRSYRPQTVAQLHIAPVREAFLRILDTGEYSHAYLLSGPKGTGKTSGARILAKVLNCESNRSWVESTLKGDVTNAKNKGKLNEPCNICEACVSITNGTSFCVLEMDGASNRGIDDVRELTSKVGLAPGDGLINVVIIDEVHMLTTEAFNALLKVLEEPPRHVVFILATTDAQKMPATVVSRCQVVQYRKAADEEVIKALSDIAKTEKIEVDADVLPRLVSYADGSFRDGVKAFEQIAKGKTKVAIEDVVMILGKSVRELSEALVQALAKRDAVEVCALFSKTASDGIDLLILQKEVLRSLHVRMLSAQAANNPHLPTYISMLKSLNLPPSISLPIPGLPFEIACLDWCMDKSEGGSARASKTPVPLIKSNKKTDMASAEPASVTLELRKKKDLIEPEPGPIDDDDVSIIPVEFASVIGRWHEVLRCVREKNPSVEALLRTTKPKTMENNVLSLEVFYKFHKEQLETARNYSIIKDALIYLFATKVKLLFVLTEKADNAAALPDSNISGVVDLSFVKAAEEAFLS